MDAKGTSFIEFVWQDFELKVPFFQRQYVWKEENWDALIDDLINGGTENFFGSLIVRVHQNNGKTVYNVIDGQQRLTTLSVLLKVCLGKIWESDECPLEEKEFFKDRIGRVLCCNTIRGKTIKLSHSSADRAAYEAVVLGKSDQQFVSHQILKCRDHFADKITVEEARRVAKQLVGECAPKIMVAIYLDEKDNEQAIFDTINTAGVRLTNADTIKNYLFQRYLDLSTDEEAVLRDFREHWEHVFANSEDSIDYWLEERVQGRIKRTTLEIFLQCVAIIKGFFNPQEQNLSELASCYKKKLDSIKDSCGVREFLLELEKFANGYRDFFVDFKDNELLKWDDSHKRSLHILRACDSSTFDPLILKLVMNNDSKDLPNDRICAALDALSSYVFRHVVAGASTKNFNKECAGLISKDTVEIIEYLERKKRQGEIDDDHVRQGLRYVAYNKIAKEILLWMEIKRRCDNKSDFEGVPSNHRYDLEHIMPQVWDKWPIDAPQVVAPETGDVVTDPNVAVELRKSAIYEIGNMALLNRKLNRSIQNAQIKIKLYGKGSNKGIKDGVKDGKVEAKYTVDVIKSIENRNCQWDEHTIRERTEELTKVFLSIW